MSGESKIDTEKYREMKSLLGLRKPDRFTELTEGFRARYVFENGYEASVVISDLRAQQGPDPKWMSVGYEEGLLELGVMKNNRMCFDTPITDDVIGDLNALEALEIIKKIENL